ncbi:hypothetical protein ACFO0S_02265 [Chryseomicrobium palamuruense]|uniref:Uncharacterized protein n=1 Tax=Chryseomicrobium palamuruense TaxID=682973 RepID=A0ABV8UTU5_9BACL
MKKTVKYVVLLILMIAFSYFSGPLKESFWLYFFVGVPVLLVVALTSFTFLEKRGY